MKDTETLLRHLRDAKAMFGFGLINGREAADLIEAQAAEIERLKHVVDCLVVGVQSSWLP